MAWVYALLGWIGGVATTIGGSWISSKIQVYHQNRTTHLEALRDKVLIPLRSGLDEHLKPFLLQEKSAVSVTLDPNVFKPSAKVTEDQTDWAIVVAADFPFGRVFGKIESALLHDAQTRHFVALMVELDGLSKRWIDYAGRCQMWVARMAGEIHAASGLQAFHPNRNEPYVMNCQLANFVHLRLLEIQTGALRIGVDNARPVLTNGATTVAAGDEDQMKKLVALLDELLESEKTHAAKLQNERADLQRGFDQFSVRLDTAIASRRLHGRCDLVSFF